MITFDLTPTALRRFNIFFNRRATPGVSRCALLFDLLNKIADLPNRSRFVCNLYFFSYRLDASMTRSGHEEFLVFNLNEIKRVPT